MNSCLFSLRRFKKKKGSFSDVQNLPLSHEISFKMMSSFSFSRTSSGRASSSEVSTSIPVVFSSLVNLACILLVSKLYRSHSDRAVTEL